MLRHTVRRSLGSALATSRRSVNSALASAVHAQASFSSSSRAAHLLRPAVSGTSTGARVVLGGGETARGAAHAALLFCATMLTKHSLSSLHCTAWRVRSRALPPPRNAWRCRPAVLPFASLAPPDSCPLCAGASSHRFPALASRYYSSDAPSAPVLKTELPHLTQAVVDKVFANLVAQGLYTNETVSAEVDWFFNDLELADYYFQRYDAEAITQHMMPLISAKQVALSTGDVGKVRFPFFFPAPIRDSAPTCARGAPAAARARVLLPLCPCLGPFADGAPVRVCAPPPAPPPA